MNERFSQLQRFPWILLRDAVPEDMDEIYEVKYAFTEELGIDVPEKYPPHIIEYLKDVKAECIIEQHVLCMTGETSDGRTKFTPIEDVDKGNIEGKPIAWRRVI